MYAFCTLHVHEEGQNCRCAFGKPAKAISTSETEFVRCSTWVADIEKCSGTTRLPSVYTSQVPDSMTTSQGHPIDSKTSTLTVGPQGPVLLQDFTFIDEMAHFDRERIPERVVHAKGAGRSVRCWVMVWAIVWNPVLWDIKIQKSPWWYAVWLCSNRIWISNTNDSFVGLFWVSSSNSLVLV